jgi:peroxiredoxin
MIRRVKPLVFLLLLLGCSGRSAPDATAARARLGSPAPAFTLPGVSGKKISLSDFKGKVVLLDFWATWCPPCRASTPALVRLGEKFKGKNFTVLGISLDEEQDAVPAFLKAEGVTHPVVYALGSTVDEDYGVRAIPSFLIIDKDGIVRKAYSGFYPGMEREWEQQINLLLGSK